MLNKAIQKFQFWASTQLPELLSTQECHKETEIHSDRAVLTYEPSRECSLDETKDKLTDVLELNPLYSGFEPGITDGGRNCCLCSRSGSGMMIKVFVKAGIGNKVIKGVVTIYESLDVMVYDLIDDIKRRESLGKCKIETPINRIYAEFIK